MDYLFPWITFLLTIDSHVNGECYALRIIITQRAHCSRHHIGQGTADYSFNQRIYQLKLIRGGMSRVLAWFSWFIRFSCLKTLQWHHPALEVCKNQLIWLAVVGNLDLLESGTGYSSGKVTLYPLLGEKSAIRKLVPAPGLTWNFSCWTQKMFKGILLRWTQKMFKRILLRWKQKQIEVSIHSFILVWLQLLAVELRLESHWEN